MNVLKPVVKMSSSSNLIQGEEAFLALYSSSGVPSLWDFCPF